MHSVNRQTGNLSSGRPSVPRDKMFPVTNRSVFDQPTLQAERGRVQGWWSTVLTYILKSLTKHHQGKYDVTHFLAGRNVSYITGTAKITHLGAYV